MDVTDEQVAYLFDKTMHVRDPFIDSMPIHIAILTGGESSEREVALLSAESIRAVLKERYEVQCFDLPRELNLFLEKRGQFQVAVPIFHGKGGEDGMIQGFLKTLQMPFLFSDVTAQAVALNKGFTKDIVRSAGVLTPEYQVVCRADEKSIAYARPSVIKPIDAGSSVGISIAKNEEAFDRGLVRAFLESSSVLIEEYIQGQEFTVAVIEEKGQPIALPVISIHPKTAFFDVESKYQPDLVEEICPALIDLALSNQLQAIAVQVHRLLGARHLTRSDFIVDDENRIWFLEINTIPGQTVHSLVPKAIRASGREIGDVFTAWIEDLLPLPEGK